MTATRSLSSDQPKPRATFLQLDRVFLQAGDYAGLAVRRAADDEVESHDQGDEPARRRQIYRNEKGHGATSRRITRSGGSPVVASA